MMAPIPDPQAVVLPITPSAFHLLFTLCISVDLSFTFPGHSLGCWAPGSKEDRLITVTLSLGYRDHYLTPPGITADTLLPDSF